MKQFASHGTGAFSIGQFAAIGAHVVFEPGALVFHPERIRIGTNVYVGHNAILKGYYRNEMAIGDNVWIGQQCFLHSAGGLVIGNNVGIGPGARITTSRHREPDDDDPILFAEVEFLPVRIGDDVNIGVNATILGGVTVGRGARIGAGAVVVRDVEPHTVVAGVPATPLRKLRAPPTP